MAVDPVTGRVDFVPSICAATAIANCLINRECQLSDLAVESLAGSGSGLAGDVLSSLASTTLEINELNVCLLAAIALAFARAGCTMPAVNPNLPDFDPDECADDLDAQAGEASGSDPLGYLKDTFKITYNQAGLPVRIQT